MAKSRRRHKYAGKQARKNIQKRNGYTPKNCDINQNVPNFEIVVLATMSAGKSTVLNALLGREVLHSANEATTATITRIINKDGIGSNSIAKAFDYQDNFIKQHLNVDEKILRDWNADPDIKTIELTYDVAMLQNQYVNIVLYDTPGPNNSQDSNHASLTMQVIEDGNYGLILYVLNATQLGVEDDKLLLERIVKALGRDSHKEIVFLLNKIDNFDEEKGETLGRVVDRATLYLENIGFKNPTIICTIAQYAMLAQKAKSNQTLTRRQKNDLYMALEENLEPKAIRCSKVQAEVKVDVLENLFEHIFNCNNALGNGEEALTEKQFNDLMYFSGFALLKQLIMNKAKSVAMINQNIN